MGKLIERCAGIDIGKRGLAVCLMIGAAEAEPKVEVAKVAVAVPAPLAPPQTSRGDAVKDRVLALVAEKTGYPVDMLDLDLDLEADLGVDTVKQAEVFAAVREAYGIVRDDKIKLRDFPTLAHVIGFVKERCPELAPAATAVRTAVKIKEEVKASVSPLAIAVPAAANDAVKERILALVVEKTGYPKDMLDLDLDLEADLGVDTVKQAELFAAIREIYDIPRDQNLKLRDFPTLKHVIQFVFDKRPDLASPAPPATVAAKQPAPVAPAVTEIPRGLRRASARSACGRTTARRRRAGPPSPPAPGPLRRD